MKCDIRGSIINYESIGSGKPIFIFGGFANDMRTMRSCMEPLFENREGWKRIYVEHLGVGDSVIGNEVKSPKEVLDIMSEFVHEIASGEEFALAGYSFGGYISRYVINRYYKKVRGMMLLNPLIHTNMQKSDVDVNVKEVKNRVGEAGERIQERFRKEIKESMIKTDFQFLNMMQSKVGEVEEELECFREVFKNPVLIITGRQDNTVGYRDAFRLLEKYPRASYAVLDRSGHEAQIYGESVYNSMVEEWIDSMEDQCR